MVRRSGQHTGRGARQARARLIWVVGAAVCASLLGSGALGQSVNPVYTDDSPVAGDTLVRVAEFAASGNESEAVRELQRLLDEQPDRVVLAPGSTDTFVSVRSRAQDVLLASPKLLERYRATEGARAQQELASGAVEAVERSRLLTAAGLEAALRVAQMRLESGQFEAGRLALEQLEAHPDRKGPGGTGGRDAAAVMAQVAKYVDRAEVWDRADRWAKEAGAPAPARGAVERPALVRAPATSLSGAPAINPEGLPTTPLWSARVEALALPDSDTVGEQEETLQGLWALPLVVGDTIYVNDGVSVAARDRFTLQVRWSVKIGTPEDPATRGGYRGPAIYEEPTSVSLYGRTLVAASGQRSSDRDGDVTVHALDAPSGKELWTAVLARLDPQLETGCAARGAPMIDGGEVVVAVRKGSTGRRIATSYLVGLSLEDGSLRWIRPIVSAGAMPFGQGLPRASDVCLLYQGVVYCIDALGAAAAVEAASGRVVWVRAMPVPANAGMAMHEPAMSWQWSEPIADGDSIIALTPDRRQVVRLDRRTGAEVTRRSADKLGEPVYLVRVKDQIAAVGRDSIVMIPIAGLEKGVAHRSHIFAPTIGGRVVPAGDRLLVPRNDAVAVLDPASPSVDAAVIKLDKPGNAIPLESQLLVVDTRNLHSYLTWTVAERLLKERMDANPGDAEPAITYAELAYRAQHPEQIAPAADKALAAIERGGASEAARLSRERLFATLRDMAEHTEAKWDGEKTAVQAPAAPPVGAPSPRAESRRRGPGTARRSPTEQPVLELAYLGPVVDRMGRAAQSPDEQVSHLMVLGRLREAEGKPALACEAYQKVLGDTALSQASWRGPSVSVRGELEATRRVRQLVTDHGAPAYAAFDAQAARELELLGPSPGAEALEKLAKQYPAASVSGPAWMRAADLHEQAGRTHSAATDLREGLAAAEAAFGAGSLKDPAALGEIAGRLVTRMQKADELFAAAQLLARLRTQYPDVPISDRGTVIDAAELGGVLAKKLSALQRLARIGAEIKPEAQAIAGWSIMPPYSKRVARSPEHLMMISPVQAQVGLWGVGTAEASGRVQMLWNRGYNGQPPKLLRIDPESVYLFWERTDAGEGAVIERIDAVTGEARWKTEPFRGLFAADPAFQRRLDISRNVIETPLDGVQKLTDVLVAMDEQVIAVVERSGRAAAFDPASGKMLWRTAAAVNAVHDIDVGGGAVAIGGGVAFTEQIGGKAPVPGAIVLDARSGELMHRFDDLSLQQVNWVRLAGMGEPQPALLVGLETQVQSYDLTQGKRNWSIVGPGGPVLRTVDAWVLGERLYMLSEERTIWMAPVASGRVMDKPLDTYEHLVGSGPIVATRTGPGLLLTAFSTGHGVCIFDAQGELMGIDALGGNDAEDGGLIPPVASEQYFVTAETMPKQGEKGQNVYSLHFLDTQTAMLKASRTVSLELPPKRIALLDGKILVTAGASTVVYSAPEGDDQRAK